MDTTPIRGRVAQIDSPAEVYLVAWSEVVDHAEDPDTLRDRLRGIEAEIAERRRRRLHLGSVPWLAYLRDRLPSEISAAEDQRDLAGWLLLMAQDAKGYLGEEG